MKANETGGGILARSFFNITGDIPQHQLTILLFLLLVPYIAGIYWPTPAMILTALLAPPFICLVVGMLAPSAGISLSLALLPLLTVEISIGSDRSISLAKLTFIVIISIWLLTRIQKILPRSALLPQWLVYIFALASSVIINGMSLSVLWHFTESIIVFAIFVAVSEIILTDQQRNKMLHLFALSGSIVVFLWILQKFFLYWNHTEIPLVLRVGVQQLTSMRNSSTLAQPNYFAAYCLLLGSIFFSLAVGKTRSTKLAIILAGIGIWTLLLFMTSVGGIISLVMALIAGGILFHYKSLKFLAMLALVTLTSAIGTSMFSESPIIASLTPERNSFLVRKYAIKIGFLSWKKNPVFGSGPGTFEEEFLRTENSYKGPKFTLHKPARSLAAHNSYLRHLVEGGIVGAAAFLWLLFSLFVQLWRKLKDNGLSHTYLFIGLLAFTVSSFFEDIFSYSVLWAIFWCTNVLVLGNGKFERLENF